MYFEVKPQIYPLYLYLTRWVAPTPHYTPSIALTSPIRISINKIKKGQNPICTFYFNPSYRHPDRHKDASTCMTVAPDTLHLFTIFQPWNPTQSKLHSFLVILVTTPYQTQNAPLVASALATSYTPPSTGIIWYNLVCDGMVYYLCVHLHALAHIIMTLLLDICRQCHWSNIEMPKW